MATPITEEQALVKISPLFHAEFKHFRQTLLQSDEEIFVIADCSCRDFADHSAGGFFGFFVVTSFRAILVCFQASIRRKKIRYYQEGQGFFYHVVADERLLGLPPSEPLLESELETSQIQEAALSLIVGVERSAYSASLGEYTFQSIELDFKGSGRGPDGWAGSVGLWRTIFDAKDGQAICTLLQSMIAKGDGQIESTITRDEMLQRLERLADLYQAGMLTDEEFRAGKARLLGL